ncbi:HD domain-containing phosphohydrolase [Denitratisoma sp. agr-D3]
MDNADDLFRRLEMLNAVGTALSQERDIQRLLEGILLAAKDITRADGGTLYGLTEDRNHLRFEIMRTDSLGLALGGTTGNPIKLPDVPLYDESGRPNDATVAAYAALHGCTVNIADVYAAAGFDFSGTRRFDQKTGYASKSFLTVPLRNHENELIGVLQLINAVDPATGQVQAFSPGDQRLAESLASQAAIALTNRQLISQLETLFESFIGLINLAIDEKSPYTAGHCQRVPELTLMLADAVNRTEQGPLADFAMSERDRYELKIASMLHDCGKVTTPVHVVDKATKLETLFDRIHLLDTRFEVIKRDAEIAALRRQADLPDPTDAQAKAAIQVELEATLRQLEDDRAFLRRCNIGGETMKDEDQDRVRRIAKAYQWRNPAGAEADFLSVDEIENLSIRAGTLTAKEREVINYHIVATIKMLEQLPWPKHLRNVPEFAGGHHERMDGKGYPKGLTRDQMSVQARIMGIADIFEALTARDRPYKAAMKVSQAVNILAAFARNGHIDPDLFQIFMQEKIYLHYAHRFLDPGQVDAVDPVAVLASL